jgi:hypothetical protein
MSTDNPKPPSTKHRGIMRRLPCDGGWRTFTQLWETLPFPRPGWHPFRNALLRGEAYGIVEHRKPTNAMQLRRRSHRGHWRLAPNAIELLDRAVAEDKATREARKAEASHVG